MSVPIFERRTLLSSYRGIGSPTFRIAVAVALAALVFGGAIVLASGGRRVVRRGPATVLASRRSLIVVNPIGNIRIVAGSRSAIVVRAIRLARSEAAFGRLCSALDAGRATIWIAEPPGRCVASAISATPSVHAILQRASTNLEITVPRGTALKAVSTIGDVDVSGLRPPIAIATVTGDVRLALDPASGASVGATTAAGGIEETLGISVDRGSAYGYIGNRSGVVDVSTYLGNVVLERSR